MFVDPKTSKATLKQSERNVLLNGIVTRLQRAIAPLVFIGLFCLSGCAGSVSLQEAAAMEPVGFWHGLWHGMILPIAWIVSLFDSSTAIYATYNNGGWYDFGFILGIGGLRGGSSSARSK